MEQQGVKSMRTSARALIQRGGNTLLIHRNRSGEAYYVLPGGGVEEGENLSGALRREVREELGADGVVGEKLLEFIDSFNGMETLHAIFRVEIGEQPVSLDGSPESAKSAADNSYTLVWVADEDVPALDIRPRRISVWLKEKGDD